MSADLLSLEELSLGEVAARLAVSATEALRLEAAGRLFSYVKPRRGSERIYPSYQLAPEIAPDLLCAAGDALEWHGPTLAMFFSARDRDMADLCVREVLAGRALDGFEPDAAARWLLGQSASCRMQAVLASLERAKAVADCS